jgi:hypothetical protein
MNSDHACGKTLGTILKGDDQNARQKDNISFDTIILKMDVRILSRQRREKKITFVWELYGVGVGNASNNLTKNVVEILPKKRELMQCKKGAGASSSRIQRSLTGG